MKKSLSVFLGAILLILLFSSPVFSQACNNWLYLAPGLNANVGIGDLDMSGDQLTVEAVFCRTTPYPPEYHGGDLVSKHAHNYDCNYVLRPNLCAILTSTQYYEVMTPCPAELNVTYHVAMVYNGSTLSIYRNGVLENQIPATGQLFQQDILAQIGYYSEGVANSPFIGYINEVRIWKVARTQAELQTYMNSSLPSPSTQTGLVAYYSFDNTLNKQGTATWDGTLHNGAQINQTNPYCNVVKATGTTGTLTGSSTCNGAPGLLTFHSQAGPGPFTLVYSDGVTTFTRTNVLDGVPFPVQIQPNTPTTYTLISIQTATSCPVKAVPGITATINPGLCTLCTGSLGDPVLDVSFGSGNGNAPPLETLIPGASTTLTYQPTSGSPASPTPQDGYYTISSTVPNNSNSSWFYGSKDHTGDVNGYMLFENPGYTTGEFFRQKLTTLCGGGKYEFAAWIANAADPHVAPNVILPDLTFIAQTEDGTVLATYNSGPVPELSSFVWHQYGFVFELPPGINTAIIRILDNNPGGTAVPGNDFAMDDITFRPCGPVMTASLMAGNATSCAGQPATLTGSVATGGYNSPAYLWQVSADSGKTWTDVPNSNTTQLTVTTPAVIHPIAYQYRMLSAEAPNISSPSCRVASNPVTLTVITAVNTEFGYTQQTCSPNQVEFFCIPVQSPSATFSWTVDGTTYAVPAGTNPLLNLTFPGYGDHIVTLAGSSSGCSSSTTKTIPIDLKPSEIVYTPDSNICIGQSVALQTMTGLSFCWSPVDGLSNPLVDTPTAKPAVTTKYHYNAEIAGTNLVANSDFSAGNMGFTSDYAFSADGTQMGSYYVGSNPVTFNSQFRNCTGQTGATGSVLMVNGNQDDKAKTIWSQSIVVQPNRNYAFAVWFQSPVPTNNSFLRFAVNGQIIGKPIQDPGESCNWQQYHTTWNSGAANTVVISILDEASPVPGNIYSLRNISFSPVTMETDSITLDVQTPLVAVTPDARLVCPGDPVQLQAAGADTYIWTPSVNLDHTDVANPIYHLVGNPDFSSITYTVSGTTERGCVATATATINQYPQLLSLRADKMQICKGESTQLYANGGYGYSWTPTQWLDDPASGTPVATPQKTTQFYLMVIDDNECPEEDSINIAVRTVPDFKAPTDETVCKEQQVRLDGPNGTGYLYLWTPATGLDDPAAPYPYASPDETSSYHLAISDSLCGAYPDYQGIFDVQVTVKPLPPIKAEKSNDIDCSVHWSHLSVSGGIVYTWLTTVGLDNPFSPTPTARIDSTTTYVVKGTGTNGCVAYDTLTVNVTATGANTFVVPNAFTPNGDGHNDHFGVTHWGDVRLEELSIYNRNGLRVFTTKNPSIGWDGNFNGQPQPADGYVYVIRALTFCGVIFQKGVLTLIR
ncbi:MAG TPA: gliding motility-associated C-terminal domain-containing protein [Puia sp.]|jgi:gliding motility-associated-like protein